MSRYNRGTDRIAGCTVGYDSANCREAKLVGDRVPYGEATDKSTSDDKDLLDVTSKTRVYKTSDRPTGLKLSSLNPKR